MRVSFQTAVIIFAAILLSSLIYLNIALAKNPIAVSALTTIDAVKDKSVHDIKVSAASAGSLMNSREALNRPLFNPTRRPFIPVVTAIPVQEAQEIISAEQQVEAAHPDLRLVGTRNINSVQSALVRQEPEGEAVWVPVGQSIAGWTLAESNSNASIFTRGGQTIIVKLYNE